MLALQKDSTRREILSLLKRKGQMSAEELGGGLGITTMGVRQHLTILERDDLVTSSRLRGGAGRPTNVYSLTERAENLFPKAYDQLAREILEEIVSIDGVEKLDLLFKRRSERLIELFAARFRGLDLEGRIGEMVRLLDEIGAMPEYGPDPDGAPVLRIYNCRMYSVAKAFPVACSYELDVLRRLLSSDVERELCQAHGDKECRYRVGGAG